MIPLCTVRAIVIGFVTIRAIYILQQIKDNLNKVCIYFGLFFLKRYPSLKFLHRMQSSVFKEKKEKEEEKMGA